MATIAMTRMSLSQAMVGSLLIAALGVAPATQALEPGSTRLRLGPPVDASEITGGALAMTLEPEEPPPWLTWLGDDVHYELAASIWNNASADGGDVYTLHAGPVWRYRPALLGASGFVEFGTSVAYVSEPKLVERHLGSHAHFTTHATVAWHLDRRERWHLGLRARHTSNAGSAPRNPGLDIAMIELGYHFAPAI